MLRCLRLLAWVGIPAGLFLAAGSVVFCHLNLHLPRRHPGGLDSARTLYPKANWSAVTLTASDGARMEAWYAANGNPSSHCVVVLHGITDSRSGPAGFAPMFLERGYSVLLPDSRGHGDSGGDLVTYGLREKEDLLGWVSWMRQRGCDAVYGLGESLGGAILLEAAGEQPVFRAVVAECAFSDLPTIARYRLASMLPIGGPTGRLLSAIVVRGAILYGRLRYGLDLDQASPVTAMAHSRTPTLLIHGLADVKTPPTHSQRLAQASGNAIIWLVPGAGHTAASRTDTAGFQSRVLLFFAGH